VFSPLFSICKKTCSPSPEGKKDKFSYTAKSSGTLRIEPCAAGPPNTQGQSGNSIGVRALLFESWVKAKPLRLEMFKGIIDKL
jgi:hypothetical protein